ncbi:DUF1211 domain-containing protein [Enterococcus sp. ALS3]|uniref:DUF1211 domain-containing protein n=1 Tax=Enterococcus alishanensis TaxID=1303817 RepID=A0ABS6TCE8_9ENTE|nr:TMEM175 family protein [Enterococcus alishanensis]MBV7390557.1 DUF1211 domain-containing protein [Enterococcus alishanensis]
MLKSRVEIFTEGIISIVTTLLVLELPQSAGGSWNDLFAVGHKLVVYLISFVRWLLIGTQPLPSFPNR